jgi:hypothetical protein
MISLMDNTIVECQIVQKTKHLTSVISALVGKSDKQLAQEDLIRPETFLALEESMQDVGKSVNVLLKTSGAVSVSFEDPLQAAGFGNAEVGLNPS